MMEMKAIYTREEIPMADKWATEDMYPSDAAWEQELASLDADIQCLGAFSGHLADSGETLYSYLDKMEHTKPPGTQNP